MKTLDVARRTSDEELSRWIKRLSLILVLGVLAFGAFYAVDRWRPAAPAIVDQQVVTLEQAVRDNPNDIAVRGQLADAYAAKGRFEDAIGQYDVIIAAGVSLEPANLGRARALQALGRLDEAAAAFEAVIAIAKDGEMAHVDLSLQAAYYGLGWIAMEQDRPLDAITHLERAVRLEDSLVYTEPSEFHFPPRHALGAVLLEEFVYNEDGQLVTTSFMDYMKPVAAGLPHFETGHIVSPCPYTLLGTKSVGEGGAIGSLAAVANAVEDALSPFGVKVTSLPITPEKVVRAVKETKVI